MKRKNMTRTALVTSIISLLLCVSMLVGATFAWFTDTSTTGSNVIQAGTLDIVLEYWNGTEWENAEGKTLEFIKGGNYNGIVGDVLWEPGCTYKLPQIRVRNEGNLTAYVVLKLNGVTGDEKLLEAIDFTTTVSNIPASILSGSQANIYGPMEGQTYPFIYGAPDGTVLFDWTVAPKGEVTSNSGHTDTSPEFTISGHMKEEAGNEYQGLKIEAVSITALATQAVYEYDSFGREYDKNATMPTVAASAAELKEALENGESVSLSQPIVLNDEPLTISSDAAIDLNGYTLSGISTSSTTSNLIKVNQGATLTIKNGTVSFGATTPDTNWGGEGQPAFPGYANNTISNSGKLIIDGATIENKTEPGGASYAIDNYPGADLVINSGKIDGQGKTAIRLFANSTTVPTNVTINGGTIIGARPIWIHLPGSNPEQKPPVNVTINGGELISTNDPAGNNYVALYSYSYGQNASGVNVTITGGTFTGNVLFGGGTKNGAENVTVTGGTFNGALGRYLADDSWEDIAKP